MVFLIILGFSIVIYMIYQSNKKSESPKIVEPRRVMVDSLKKNTLSNQDKIIIDDAFSRTQKLAVISTLQMISLGTNYNKLTHKRMEQIIMLTKTQLSFGITQEEREEYELYLTPSSLQMVMHSLSKIGKEFFLTYVFDLLATGGNPSEIEIGIAINTCKKIVGISDIEFSNSIQKIDSMMNVFFKP